MDNKYYTIESPMEQAKTDYTMGISRAFSSVSKQNRIKSSNDMVNIGFALTKSLRYK